MNLIDEMNSNDLQLLKPYLAKDQKINDKVII